MALNPYDPPQTESTGTDPVASSSSGVSYPLKTPDSKWLFRAVIAFSVVQLITIVVDLLNAATLMADNTWIEIGENAYAPFWIAYSAAAFAMMAFYIILIVLYGSWVRQANRNARSFGMQGMQFTPGWCLGWFFVPIANLIQPYKAVRELHQTSSEAADPGDRTSWNQLPAPLVGWWWCAWIFANCVTSLENRLFAQEAATEAIARISSTVGVISGTLMLIAAYLLCRVVKSINERQIAKRKSLAGAKEPVATSPTPNV